MRGKLITLEGIECCGKGTQTELLMQYLILNGINAINQHEPGGTPYGEALRALLKFPHQALSAIYDSFAGHSDFPLIKHLAVERTALAELFMFEAVRAEYAHSIRQLIESGITVVSDRLMDSTTAYQGGGRGIDKKLIDDLNVIAMQGLWPDITFLLDISVEEMISRMKLQNDEKNAYFEKTCDKAFFERVRQAYLEIAQKEPQRFVVVDGALPKEQVFESILPHINLLLKIG